MQDRFADRLREARRSRAESLVGDHRNFFSSVSVIYLDRILHFDFLLISEDGHGHDEEDCVDWDGHPGRGWGAPGWRGPGWDGPEVYVNLPCVTGPAGIVTVCP